MCSEGPNGICSHGRTGIGSEGPAGTCPEGPTDTCSEGPHLRRTKLHPTANLKKKLYLNIKNIFIQYLCTIVRYNSRQSGTNTQP